MTVSDIVLCTCPCRDLAFKLKPLNLSKTLIEQLLALEKVFSQKAGLEERLDVS